MKLRSLRVQNYKKIKDTGWVSCCDLTVFVGKNEAGKSALFRGLSKLNPSDGEKYDGLKEFPRRRYTDEFSSKDWPAASGRFDLTSEEQSALASIAPDLPAVASVECTRHYSWTLDVQFQPPVAVSPVLEKEFQKTLAEAQAEVGDLVAPEGKGEALGAIKSNLQSSIEAQRKARESRPVEQGVARGEVETVLNLFTAQANETWQREVLQPLIDRFKGLIARFTKLAQLEAAKKWVADNLPRFIYFDKYDVIETAIHMPTFAQQVGQNPPPPRVRTTHCLFKHVGLDVSKLRSLGRHAQDQGHDPNMRRQVDERAILSSSASNAMTAKFSAWWEQRRHKFRYQIDGDYFRIWVSDDLDPSEIELDQRSAGMQYFFSFFTVFLVESAGAHQNSILLLDEPGLHMHGTAQSKLVKFFEKLSKDNQTLYSTHSPFMIDGDHLERARAVFEDEDGTTKVSEDVWPRDKDSLFPLQAALGYQLAQSLFVSKRQLVLEGITDYWLLKALLVALEHYKLPALDPSIVLVPSAGVSKLLPLASMLLGHGVEVAALLDGDEPARKEGKKLVEKLLAGDDRKCLFIGDFVQGNANAELEDVFPESFYLAAVTKAHGKPVSFTADEKKMPGIVDRLEAAFARLGYGKFEKWKCAALLRDEILAKPSTVPVDVCKVVSAVMDKVNALFGATVTN